MKFVLTLYGPITASDLTDAWRQVTAFTSDLCFGLASVTAVSVDVDERHHEEPCAHTAVAIDDRNEFVCKACGKVQGA